MRTSVRRDYACVRLDKIPIERRNGPVRKVRKLFEGVSELPRRQQDKVVEFVSALVEQYKRKEHGR